VENQYLHSKVKACGHDMGFLKYGIWFSFYFL